MLSKYIKAIGNFIPIKAIYATIIICWIAIITLRKVDFSNVKSFMLSLDLFFVTIPEMTLLFIVFALLAKYCGKFGKMLVWLLSLLFFIITAIQYYYFYISGEFVSQLALENIHQLYLLLNVWLYVVIAFAVFAVLIFWINFNFNIRAVASNVGWGGGSGYI